MTKIEIPLKKDYAGAFKYWVDTNTENGVCTIPEYICKGIVEMLGKQPVATDTNVGDTISRQAAIDSLDCINGAEEVLRSLPPAQPEPSEITDEQAILHLQSTGWMQNHDREMYESGLRKQLADDSESYNSLIPCEDAISRQVAIDVLAEWEATHMWDEWCNDHKNEAEKYHITAPSAVVKTLPSAEPERKKGHWILYDKRFPWSKDYKCSECGNYINISDINAGRGSANFCPNCGAKMEEKQYE